MADITQSEASKIDATAILKVEAEWGVMVLAETFTDVLY